MNKIKFIIIAAIVVSTFSCSDDFLERKDLYRKSNASYYRTEKDMGEALTGAYSVLPVTKGERNPILIAAVLSDDILGGGDGAADSYIRQVDKFEENTNEDVFEPLWRRYYQGIFRVNSIIDNAGNAEYDNEENLKRDIGEAYFLRAFMYFQLSKFFGTVPLIVTPLSGNEARAEVAVTFAQIATDLKTAAEMLPATPYGSMDPQRDGHATKWAAEALMARVFLFYTGTYNQTDLPLNAEVGGSITKADAVAYLESVMSNSGHRLVEDFPNLWAYSATGLKENTVMTNAKGEDLGYSVPSNKFVSDGNYEWVMDSGENPEFIWSFKFNTYGANPEVDLPRANQIVLFSGIRTSPCVPHGVGWGWCTVHPDVWNSFEDGDIRKQGSMFNVEDATSADLEGTTIEKFQQKKASYDGYNVTGVFNKKWMPVQQQNEDLKSFTDLWIFRGYTFESTQFAYVRPIPILRYADVLLMHTELTGDLTGINAVRSRAGLGAAPDASIETILSERRHELFFEGQRYFDLMRTGKLAARFAEMAANPIMASEGGMDAEGVFYNTPYGANEFSEGRKFIQVPESQIRLSAGMLEQNEGWE